MENKLEKFNHKKNSLFFIFRVFIFLVFYSCSSHHYRGWNNYPKYKTYIKVSLNDYFSENLNCSNKGYEWKIKNEKELKNIRFLEKIQQNKGCSELWKFQAIKKGKDSIVLEYRKGNDIIIKNTIIVDIE